MGKNNKEKSLSWDVFQSLGNPENVEDPKVEETSLTQEDKTIPIRVLLDKKGRRGKQVTLITGLSGSEDQLEKMTKALKSRCGVGGSLKDGVILLQGDQRNSVLTYFQSQGYSNVKKSGG